VQIHFAVQSAKLSQARYADCGEGRYCWADDGASLNLGGFGRMQNRYVADIGDYVKLAILRRLGCGRRLGVAWWLFPDEHHNTDGSHREYLAQRDKWAHFDPDLFEALLKIENEKKLDMLAIEEAAVLPNAVFASHHVPCEVRPFSLRPTERRKWLDGIKTKLKGGDLVFLDPDNGIAPEGLKLTRRRAGKSVTMEEIKALQENDRAMVIYHHQTRFPGGHHSEICDLAARLEKSGLQVSGALRAKPWAPRVFFILNGDEEMHYRAKSLEESWENWIEWCPISKILKNPK
jgi:hypothetical protein